MFIIEYLRKRIFDWTFYSIFILYHVGKNTFLTNLNYSEFMSVAWDVQSTHNKRNRRH